VAQCQATTGDLPKWKCKKVVAGIYDVLVKGKTVGTVHIKIYHKTNPRAGGLWGIKGQDDVYLNKLLAITALLQQHEGGQ
jgi:hypothetical protein